MTPTAQGRSSPQTSLETDISYRGEVGLVGSVDPTVSRRRRRRLSTTPSTSGYSTSAGTEPLPDDHSGSEPASQEQPHTIQSHAHSRGPSPSPKRRRLSSMRLDGISSANGYSQGSNGTASSPSRKTDQTPYVSFNGDTPTNGHAKPSANLPSYYGHDREEVTRILIQSLYELGYNGAASLLGKESGYQLESPAVAEFRNAVLEGRWPEAESILLQSFYPYNGGSGKTGHNKEKLLLAEGADKSEMLFYLRQQKFLELLEARDLGAALIVLRHELTPLNYDIGRLHALSRCVIYIGKFLPWMLTFSDQSPYVPT